MGRLIEADASAARIVRDLRDTVANGATQGEPVKGIVEGSLARYVAVADAVAVNIGAEAERARRARAERDTQDQASRDLILLLSDTAYNLAGRGSDPVLDLVYPMGGGTFADGPPAHKAFALELNAMLLETSPHPRLSAAWVADAAQRLRAQAAVMRAAADAVPPVAVALSILTKQYIANARRGRVELARTKKTFAGLGMSEHDIHLVIPSHPRRQRKPKAPKAAEAQVADILNEAQDADT